MTLEAFHRRDWQAVIAAHPLESHDPEEWLRYGVALLQTLTPGPDVGKQQQQAALAFVQVQKEGAPVEAADRAQLKSALFCLKEALDLAGIKGPSHQMAAIESTNQIASDQQIDTSKTSHATERPSTQRPSPYHYRTAIPLRFSFLERREGNLILQSTHNSGYFSCLSTILWDLISCANHGQLPDEVRSKHGMIDFKDQDDTNLFGLQFLAPQAGTLSAILTGKDIPIPAHHGDYGSLDHQLLAPFLNAYFQPNERITQLMGQLTNKYEIRPEKLLAVCYRGTDKWREVEPVPVAEYALKARSILARESNMRALIQTDQRQVRDFLLYELRDSAFAIEELPVTDGLKVIHQTLEAGRQNFADCLLAATLIMSRAHFLITHTGNVSFWSVLFRGSSERVEQFGALSNP